MRPSPLPNRVAPDGSLHAVPDRGGFMGNRGGRLHRPDGTLGRARWRSRAWICCLTQFRGRRRAIWGEGYTELFFLDEATALAAGHRPCFECRRADAHAFSAAWERAFGAAPRAGDMDRALHAERRGAPETANFGSLPDGTIFLDAGQFWLRAASMARRWSFAGYGPAQRVSGAHSVAAVTPASVRAVLRAGYPARLHPSARA